MTIFVADTSIRAMNNEFGLLVAGNISRRVYCLLLRLMDRGCALITCAFDGPTVLMRNNMLIFSGHDGSPTIELWEPRHSAGLSMDSRCSTIRCSCRQQEDLANPT